MVQERRGPIVARVAEETILDACGDRELPRMGAIEQRWRTDPIPTDEIESRAAEPFHNGSLLTRTSRR